MVAGFFMKRGWAVGKARKGTMLFCAAIMPAFSLSVLVPNAWHAVILFGLATAAHAAWATNLFTTTSDVFPAQAVGSTNGFGTSLGGFGGALFSGLIPGAVIPVVGYVPVLLTMSCFYLIAWLIMHRMMGNLEPVVLSQGGRQPVPLA
jgi:ACS family hexuronate transporter-like MFS transporter